MPEFVKVLIALDYPAEEIVKIWQAVEALEDMKTPD